MLALKRRVAELETEAAAARDSPPPGTESLAQGDDRYEINIAFTARKSLDGYPYHHDTRFTASITSTWNAIFAAVAPSMINEAADNALHGAFRDFLTRESLRLYQERKQLKDLELRDFTFHKDEIETCIVQLRALGLIKESDKKRSVKDMGTYWTLTPYGNTLMVQLRAIRHESLEEEEPDDVTAPQESGPTGGAPAEEVPPE